MIPVYDAAHSTDAHLIKSLLERAGIQAHIRGEYLQGALGEIPVSGQIAVCVGEQDADRAREIVLEWQQSAPEAIDDDPDEPPPSSSPSSGGSVLRSLIGFALGAALGAAACWALLRTPEHETTVDFDGSGIVDQRHVYGGSQRKRTEIDRNRDGKPDLIHYYDWRGRQIRSEYDDDFDGRMETVVHYRDGLWSRRRTDRNGDGNIDYLAEATAGVLFRETWFDAENRPLKRIVYERGIPSHGEFDSNGDGAMDTRRSYDARGEIAGSAPVDSAQQAP